MRLAKIVFLCLLEKKSDGLTIFFFLNKKVSLTSIREGIIKFNKIQDFERNYFGKKNEIFNKINNIPHNFDPNFTLGHFSSFTGHCLPKGSLTEKKIHLNVIFLIL